MMDERYDEVDDIVRVRRLPSLQIVGTPTRTTLDLNALTTHRGPTRRPIGRDQRRASAVLGVTAQRVRARRSQARPAARRDRRVGDRARARRPARARLAPGSDRRRGLTTARHRSHPRRHPHDRLGHRLSPRLLLARRAGPRPQGTDPPRRRGRRRLAGHVPDGHAVPSPPQVDASSTAPATTPRISAPTSPPTSTAVSQRSSDTGTPSSEGDDGSRPVTSFLADPPPSAAVQRLFDEDLQGLGLCDEPVQAVGPRSGGPRRVVRAARSRHPCRVAHVPSTSHSRHLAAHPRSATRTARWRGARSWPPRPAPTSPSECYAATTSSSTSAERALARWARQLARDPNSTTAADVQALRAAGFDDAQIFAITVFVALRIAFSTVNDALGAAPDRQLGVEVPAEVRDAVTFGRPIA